MSIIKKKVWATPDGTHFDTEADAQLHQAIVEMRIALDDAADFTGAFWDRISPEDLARALLALGYRLTKEA